MIETVCGMYCGTIGKKHIDIRKFYEELDKQMQAETGKSIEELPEIIYRFIVTCLESIGLKRIPNSSNITVDVSEIYYNDIYE